jgi:hypothetical protein
VKHFIAGCFIAVAMAGMDQEMMQKNISVRTLRRLAEERRADGGDHDGRGPRLPLPRGLCTSTPDGRDHESGDRLFPAVVMQRLARDRPGRLRDRAHFGAVPERGRRAHRVDLELLRGHPAASRSARSRRGATARIRKRVHLAFAALFFALVLVFEALGNPSMIGCCSRSRRTPTGRSSASSPSRSSRVAGPPTGGCRSWPSSLRSSAYAVNHYQEALLGSYRIGLEILVLNGALTFAGLWLASRKP